MTVSPGRDEISSSPPASRTRSRMPTSPKPSGGACGSKPRPSSRTSTRDVVLERHAHGHALGARVLGDVAQRLLNQPVDRRLELAVEPPADLDREVHLDALDGGEQRREAPLVEGLDSPPAFNQRVRRPAAARYDATVSRSAASTAASHVEATRSAAARSSARIRSATAAVSSSPARRATRASSS
jgi:hypothetical protein